MNKKAFSLIEIILVIVVISMASLGLVVVMQQVLLDTHKPEVISIATALAEKEAERVIKTSFASVLDENHGSPANYSGDFSNYSWEVRVDSIDDVQSNLGNDPGMNNYKVVEVRVHHASIDYISLVFLKTNYSP